MMQYFYAYCYNLLGNLLKKVQQHMIDKNKQRKYQQFLFQKSIGKLLLTLSPTCLRQFDNISSLTQAKALYLCQKNIRDMPDLSQLPNLQILWLNSNILRDIGRSLDSTPNLKQIYLNNNQIQSLQGYQKCSKLEKLNLANNNISQFSPSLYLSIHLKSLVLTRNKLSSIEQLTYLSLPHLQNLYLCYNQLTSCKILRRLNCPNLKNLYLHNNKISDFHNYDQILMSKNGMINLINVEQTKQDKNATIIKLGIIIGPRCRAKESSILFC